MNSAEWRAVVVVCVWGVRVCRERDEFIAYQIAFFANRLLLLLLLLLMLHGSFVCEAVCVES